MQAKSADRHGRIDLARMLATAIDLGLVTIIVWVIGTPAYYLGYEHLGVAGYLVLAAVVFLYFAAPEWRWGATFGKWLFERQVLSLDGGRITTRQAAIRNSIRLIDWLPIAYLLGATVAIARGGRLGDLAAGTQVVPMGSGQPKPVQDRAIWVFWSIVAVGFVVVSVLMAVYANSISTTRDIKRDVATHLNVGDSPAEVSAYLRSRDVYARDLHALDGDEIDYFTQRSEDNPDVHAGDRAVIAVYEEVAVEMVCSEMLAAFFVFDEDGLNHTAYVRYSDGCL